MSAHCCEHHHDPGPGGDPVRQAVYRHALWAVFAINAAMFAIEIGAGLGVMAGKAWRIGLMGHGSTVRNVALVLAAHCAPSPSPVGRS